jgi:hypothetical protein
MFYQREKLNRPINKSSYSSICRWIQVFSPIGIVLITTSQARKPSIIGIIYVGGISIFQKRVNIKKGTTPNGAVPYITNTMNYKLSF